MTQLNDRVKYELIDYQVYRKRLNDLFKDETLLEMGLSYSVLGKTTYGYDLDCLKIGTGDNHLFIVGGTHGSEIISVDFVTQLVSQIKNMPFFDPNLFSLYIIPLQNPEGFEVTTATLRGTKEVFNEASKEYYLKYRMDNVMTKIVRDLNIFISSKSGLDAKNFINEFKRFINNNVEIKGLHDKRAIPEINVLIGAINGLGDNLSFGELRVELLNICNKILDYLNMKEKPGINDVFFMELLAILKNYFSSDCLWENVVNDRLKLHQEMFCDVGFDGIGNNDLRSNVEKMYAEFNHPLGSQVTFDATGVGINLNANTPLNPGVEEGIKNIRVYGLGARNNIINHVAGPLGSPSLELDNFSFALENKALYHLLEKSYREGHYLATFLYHGTGGMIYYLPSKKVSEETSLSYLQENTELAECYERSTGYRLMPESTIMGYGDLLRGTLPNVLMIELSKMGGNPLAPYGDEENILRCFQDNYEAINGILKYFSYRLEGEKVKGK